MFLSTPFLRGKTNTQRVRDPSTRNKYCRRLYPQHVGQRRDPAITIWLDAAVSTETAPSPRGVLVPACIVAGNCDIFLRFVMARLFRAISNNNLRVCLGSAFSVLVRPACEVDASAALL